MEYNERTYRGEHFDSPQRRSFSVCHKKTDLWISVDRQSYSEEMERFCVLTPEAKKILLQAVNRYSISMRTYGRIRKVARTIADLAGSDSIEPAHVAEAIQYRTAGFEENN